MAGEMRGDVSGHAMNSRASRPPCRSPRISVSEPPAAGRSDGAAVVQRRPVVAARIDHTARPGLHGCQLDRVEAEQSDGGRRDRRAEMVEGERGGVGRRASRGRDHRAEGDRLMGPAGRRRHRVDTIARPDAGGRPEELAPEAATRRRGGTATSRGRSTPRRVRRRSRPGRRRGRRCGPRTRRRPVRWWRAVRAGSAPTTRRRPRHRSRRRPPHRPSRRDRPPGTGRRPGASATRPSELRTGSSAAPSAAPWRAAR